MASIVQRGKNSYRITVSEGYTPEGKKAARHKTVIVPEKMTARQRDKFVKEQAYEFEKAVKSGTYYDGGGLTFGQYAAQWLERAEKNLSPSTLHTYRIRVQKRLIPALGHIKLVDLRRTQLRSFYESLADEGQRLDTYYFAGAELLRLIEGAKPATAKEMGVDPQTLRKMKAGKRIKPHIADKVSIYFGISKSVLFEADTSDNKLSLNTINHIFDLVSSILTAAVEDELIPKSPQPKAPKTTRPKRTHYDEEQLRVLLAVFDNEPLMYRAMGYLLVDSGIRRGELTGLKWENVDLKANTIFISEQRQYTPSHGEFTRPPKTESGTRLISVSPTVISIMRELRKNQFENRLKLGNAWFDSDYVFRHDDGKPIAPNKPYRWLRALIAKHSLPHLTVHGLRHTNASVLADRGYEGIALSSRLGHANLNVTNAVYLHEMKAKKKVGANIMEGFYTEKPESAPNTELRGISS
jgi:integrase